MNEDDDDDFILIILNLYTNSFSGHCCFAVVLLLRVKLIIFNNGWPVPF